MYCRNCGNEIADGSKFCNHCGNPVEVPVQPEVIEPGIHTKPMPDVEADAPRRTPVFEEFQWNVSEYPDRNAVEKTEEIDFNWNANPADIPDGPRKTMADVIDTVSPANLVTSGETLTGEDLEKEVFGQAQPQKRREEMSAMERLNSFYTFNQKNEEFQKLINQEYQRVQSGNAIEHEMSEADKLAEVRLETRRATTSTSMDDFLEREGVVKPYQPKAFESDVLQRIEAQEAEREAKRLEEEARLAAIEEARLEAEAKKRAEEEARRKAEEEARRLEEIARQQAEEEARAAEEARLRAIEEEKRRIEEEARMKAEAEARVKAAEEARLRAEADLRAAQEAAKIRAQQEARLAAEAEAQFKAEQERKRFEEEEARRQLEEKRKRLAQEANQAVAQAEVRKVLEQTARMRAEEEAKIKAAVAGLRSGTAAMKEPEISKEVQEAHQATRNQINEMAKARDAYFADLTEAPAAPPSAAPAAPAEPAIPVMQEEKPVTGRETMLSSEELVKTRVIRKADIEAGLNEPTRVAAVKPAPAPADDDEFFNSFASAGTAAAAGIAAGAAIQDLQGAPQPEPQPMEFKEPAKPVDDFDDLLSQFESVTSHEETPDYLEDFPSDQQMPQSDEYALYQEQETYLPQENTQLNDTMLMPQSETIESMPGSDFDSYGNVEAARYMEQQAMEQSYQEPLQQQLFQQPAHVEAQQDVFESSAADEFYGDDFYADEEEQLSKKELKQREKEQKRLEKERAKEEKALKKREKRDYIEPDDDDDDYEEKGGKGRIVLKVILVILIIVLIAEVVGMGIRFMAPQSKAAEFIDNQLNKVIQMITGDDTEYSVVALQVRTEPMEDKTDLINAQKGKNKNGNIQSIVYSSDLVYDQGTDGEISDLVLSQPMTIVEWGRDDENYPVYYDEQVVGQIIAFESNKVNLMNKGNEKVLGMIDPESSLYAETAALKGQAMPGAFTKLEIGEIRQAGTNYYVWVRETIGDTTTEKVYSMYPKEKFVMVMTACYES